jgi:anthranilate synthase/aminodeoxychorismate synthase-like glutamine amidotransferase
MSARILLIDNYDSFTYNLVQAFLVLGAEVDVRRNDEIDVVGAQKLAPTHLVISPGPGRPDSAGCSLAMIGAFGGRIPVLGVCLGHQSIAQHYGGRVVPAKSLMHGKTSLIEHNGEGLFEGLPNPFEVGRYHSLAAEQASLPADLEVTAKTRDGEIMGLRHRKLNVVGVQFHPESVLTPEGPKLLGNFLRMTRGER